MSLAWPAGRTSISAGHLELTDLVADQHEDCAARIFDPRNLVDGIEPSVILRRQVAS